MTRTRQGGSIVGYVVIGSVLALLLIGGVFFAKQKSVAPDTSKAPSVAQEPQEQQSPPQSSDKKPDEKQTVPQPSHEVRPRHESHAKELPKTGMGDILPAIMLSAIVFLAASYLQSRRQLSSL